MPDKKVKISNILNSQIPDFILDDGSLFKEFLEQYYASEEHEYGTTYLADNLESIKKISTLSDITTVEAQTIPAPGSTVPSSPVVVSAEAYAYDDVIYVNQTTGFPDKWGLLKIDDEIITYTGKTATSFTGCKRGFSGIDAIETAGNPEFLTFSETNSSLHETGTLVVNLSFLFLIEFYKKHKYQFLPGLEGRNFKQGLALENILSRAKDFYSSKGTDTALEILFQALYGEQVEIVKPFNETLIPSEAEWNVTEDMVVEAISGNPLKLVGSKIFQDSTANPTASGAVANVQQVFLNNKRYYQIKFSRGSLNSTFKVGGKTKVIGTASTTSVTTVDSTVGFSTVGTFYYLNADNVYTSASYESKSSNQFFGCVGISTVLKENDPIIDETFIFGYEDNDLTKLCQMRVTGSISGASDADTKFFANDDAITVKYLGEKVDPNDPKFESWFYNNISYIDVEENISNNTFKTNEKHFLKNGDIVDVLYQDTFGTVVSEDIVSDVVGDYQFKISNNTVNVNGKYIIRKKLNYVSSKYGIPSLLSNIQNTFVDDDKNTYVAFSGYPSFDAETTNGSQTFTSIGVSTNTSTISFVDDHNFYNGEKIYVGIGTEGVVDDTNTKFSSGYYYVKLVDVKNIQLCVNLSTLYAGIVEPIKFNGESASGIHTVTPANLYKTGNLKSQDNFKRILKTPELVDNNSDIIGPIGVSLNGVELHSPISNDSVYYGPITDVDVLNMGQDYDIVNPPKVSVGDTHGTGALINVNFSGNISDVVLTSKGFDYVETPTVSITGGNGSGAICEAKMRGYTHSETFTDFDVQLTDPGRIDTSHKFLDGEQVTYTAYGTPIGIGSTQVGFATDRLASGTTYYIAKHSTNSFGLAISRADALNKINLIHFNQYGNTTHEFKSTKVRNIVDRIVINDPGSSYSNRKVTVQSQVYPPTNVKDLFKTYVGINTFDNYVYAKNHNFKEGDIVQYRPTGDLILGLSTEIDYKVSVVDENTFKLSRGNYPKGRTNYVRGSNLTDATLWEVQNGSSDVWQAATDGTLNPDGTPAWWYKPSNASGGRYHRLNNYDFGGVYLDEYDTSYTVSVFAKRVTTGSVSNLNRYLELEVSGELDENLPPTGHTGTHAMSHVTFDLQNLTSQYAGQSAVNVNGLVGDPRIEDYGNGWYRCSYVFNTGRSDSNSTLGTDAAAIGVWFGHPDGLEGDDGAEIGNNNPSFYLWGAQIEKGQVTSPYIPTTSSSITVDKGIDLLDYDRNIITDLNSVGVGTHTFKYPDIAVNINGEVGIGTTTTIESYYNATAYAEVKGSVSNVFVESGGSSYGVDNIINYTREPKIRLLTGKNANLQPFVDSTGKITNVLILNKGSEYTTPPELRVSGTGKTSGQFAKLRAIVTNGEITGVDIINAGVNYDVNDTFITVVPAGTDAKFGANVYKWKLNNVSQFSHLLSNSDYKDIVQFGTQNIFKENKICSFYAGNYYRQLLGDDIEDVSGVLKEKTPTSHSKIIGWAYDGNPIYGPVGEVGIGLTYMQSSYVQDPVSDSGLRPSTSNYSPGSFIQDYVYNASGDLDEYNGKFVKTPEYPNGTYAYFSTIDKTLTPNSVPTFPYITKKHRNKTDLFNYDVLMNQSDKFLNSGKYKRNVTHFGLNDKFKTYPILSDSLDSDAEIRVDSLNSGKISKIIVNDGGESYKPGELIKFNNNSISASIDEVYGKNIISVETTDTINDDLKFSIVDGKVTGLSTLPHGLTDKDIVEISGITSSLYTNIEGFRTIGVSSVTSGLSSSMVNSGVTTFISLHDSTLSGKFNVNDIIQVESEQLQVIAHDDYNNRYRVTRGYNGTTASGHGSGAAVYRLEKEFTYDIPEKLENKNIEFPKIQYFEGAKSVGLGSVYTDVVVGYAGSVAIKKSIPPRSIYLPNHKFKTGDLLSFVSVGSTIFVSGTDALTPAVDLSTYGNLYCVKLSDEFIGLSTQKANYTTTHSWFTVVQNTGGDNNSLEIVTNNVNGRFKKVSATVTTDSNHSLEVNDNVRLDISPNRPQIIDLRFNSDIRKLVVDPVTIVSTGIGTITDEITITNHNFNTGDIIVYNSSTPASPLVNDGIYHVIDESDNTIRLAETKYDVNLFPYNYIGIGITGGNSHTFTKINPRIELYEGNTAEFLVSDTSLNGYDIAFYSDKDFKTRYDSGLITRTGTIGDGLTAKINVSLGSSISNKLYYRIEGKDLNYTKTYPSAVESDVVRSSEIEVVESKFNKIHRITGVANTTFTFNMVGSGETTLYNNLGITSAFYATDSSSVMGGIYSVKIVSNGEKVNKLPIITSIGTTTGKNALFTVESLDIGKVNDTTVYNQGLEFSRDKTIPPKADSNIILELKDVFTLKSIGVTTGGTNYTSSPVTIAIDKPSIVTRTNLVGNSVDSVDILSNDSGLSDSLRIVPTVNSNGVQVIGAVTNSTQMVTLEIRGPVNGFDADNPFPFAVGDKVFVENIKVTESDADGYNSSDYEYKYFTLTGINTTGGTESVSYSIAGIGSTGGTYDRSVSNFGRIVNVEDLASYSPTFEKTSFFENEIVRVPNKNIFGYVAKNGWDPEAQTLKLYNITGEFNKNDRIVGDVSNNKAGIDAVFTFDFNLDVNSTVENINKWKDDVGKLNLDRQRIHDNDYYQRFSYAIKGENIPYLTWRDPVSSLSHTAGFKGFSNLGITSTGQLSTKVDADLFLNVTLDAEASVWERWYYDNVTEETNDPNLSKIVKFENRIITKYNESRTNKVLLIDDISSQFNGITTSVGGGIIGLSTFAVYTGGDRLFYKNFNPVTGIDTTTHEVTIPRHEFNTGERLRYTQHTGPIGIDTTTVPGVGSTNILPTDVYAIKVTDDKFQVAVARTFATAGTAVTFTTVSGIGTIHNLQVPTEDASIRSVITVDNIIQSPIAITTAINVNLTGPIGINTNFVYLNSVADISGKSLINIDQEIFKVSLVGVGSARELDVLRGQMGTVAAAHTVGAAVTVIKGDYKIENGNIYFSDAPYGPAGIGSLTSQSTFAGRSYYRLDYTSNKIMDDISDRFDGATDKFDLTTNGAEMSGITSSFGMVLVNNIFQRPDVDELSGESSSDYSLVGTGKTIDFTGTSANKDLPKGGIINEFDVGIGSGYQLPRRALLDVVINSNTGTISTVGILTGGSGYLTAPMVSIASTDRHFSHSFVSAANNAVNGSLTPTNAEYTSTTGMMVLTIPGHTLTTSNTVQFTNNSITMSCSRDNYTTNHTYPRATDPVAGVATAILATSEDTVTVFVGVGSGDDAVLTTHITDGSVSWVNITNAGTGYTSTGIGGSTGFAVVDSPKPYKNIPLSGGSGSGAAVDVVVGTGGSIVDFKLSNRGIGYEIGEQLQIINLPFQAGIATSRFNITIRNKYQDKFAGWCFGELIELDDFSNLFNGYRKAFLITRTGAAGKEYYSVVAKEGSGIILANNLFLFLNDILQIPDRDYEFNGGTRITFKEAPKPGSKFKFYLYAGSDLDYAEVDVDETVKPGDELKLQAGINTITGGRIPEQDNRIIYELIAADTVETQTYSGIGIVTDPAARRPTMWRKQTKDMLIDGVRISKERNYLEPQIYPTSGIIKSVSTSDSIIWIEDSWLYDHVDELDQDINNVRIVGLGTIAESEIIEKVQYNGDYGTVVGIGTSAVGIGTTTSPALYFDLKVASEIFADSPNANQVKIPGIGTGGYFTIRDTHIGPGVTGIVTHTSEVVSVGNTFLDNVYYAADVVGMGATTLRVFANITSLSGIDTSIISDVVRCGSYSWGSLTGSRGSGAKSYTFHNQNGLIGIQTSAQVIRDVQLKVKYT